MSELEHVLQTAVSIAREAGELLLRGQRGSYAVEKKGGSEFVTECDKRSEALIVGRLRESLPEHRIVAEEGGGDAEPGQGVPTWYVDPLDGTNNFAHGLPWYTVSLGLEQDDQALVAVVHAPSVGWTWTATRGGGCRLDGMPTTVSRTARLEDALVATGFAYDRWTSSRNNLAEFGAMLMCCSGVRRVGVASLDCAMVASGWLDAYWEFSLRRWDVSAGALLVTEAGGRLSASDGGAFCSGKGDIVASNGALHDAVLAALAGSAGRRDA